MLRKPSAQGHTSLIYPATASSSLSTARWAGTWQDQMLRSSSFRTPWMVLVRWNRRPITVLTLLERPSLVPPPRVARPLSNSASS